LLLLLFSVGSEFSECLCARAVDADTATKTNKIRQDRTNTVFVLLKKFAFMGLPPWAAQQKPIAGVGKAL
jgi:hypothetical protein